MSIITLQNPAIDVFLTPSVAILTFTYSVLTVKEADLLHDLHRAVSHSYWNAKQFSDSLLSNGHVGLLLQKEGVPLGFCLCRCVLDEAELLHIALLPEAQGLGLSSALWAQMRVLLLQKKIARVFLELRVSNARALAAYCAWGFTQQGLRKQYYSALLEGGEPEDALLMTLILKERLAAC